MEHSELYGPDHAHPDGLLRLFRLAMGLHVLTGVNSTIPETREYWRAKHPETEPMWVKRND